jgi:putative transposase
MKLKGGKLGLSNGKANAPRVLDWPWELPQTVVIHWTGTQYEAIATYRLQESQVQPPGEKVVGIDLGEIHLAVAHDGRQTHILNGRLLSRRDVFSSVPISSANGRGTGTWWEP